MQMNSSGQSGRNLVLIICLLLIAVATAVDLLALDIYGIEDQWAFVLITLMAAVSFAIEISLSFHGLMRKYFAMLMVALIVTQGVVASVAEHVWEGDSWQDSLAFFAIVVLISFLGYIVKSAVLPGTMILRVFKGYGSSGSLEDASVVLKVPENMMQKYSQEIIEDQFTEELVHHFNVNPILVPSSRTRIDYSIAKADNDRAFYRLRNGIVEVLFLSLDGRVCRFESGNEKAMKLEFRLEHLIHFSVPSVQERSQSLQSLNAAFTEYSKPSIRLKEFVVYTGERIRSYWHATVVIVILALLALAIFSNDSSFTILKDQRVLLYMTIVSGIVSIIALIDRLFRRRPKSS